MPATSNKHRIFNQVFGALPKQLDVSEHAHSGQESAPVLEQFIYGICRDGSPPSACERAFRRLKEGFFDWNEVRVSSMREIAETLSDLTGAETRAQKIIQFLQEVFELNYSFDLDNLHKKGLKVAAKQLGRYQAADEFNIPWVIQRSLGGHSIPLDDASHRVLQRLGIIERAHGDRESARSSLEHQVPKAKGALFTDLISTLADEYCREESPRCHSCPMTNVCPKIREQSATPESAVVATAAQG